MATLLAATGAALLLHPPAAGAAGGPEQQLIEAYSPVTMLREQEDPPCDKAEEQFLPTTVDVMLGNPRVSLVVYDDGKKRVLRKAPTAAQIAGLGSDYYLDVPGKPLSAGCTYARDFAGTEAAGKAPAITYAHIAKEDGHGGFVVQYWFFYYFNQFNDLHEGDWEGMQIAFDESTPAEALASEPTEIALFQHAGGERADWSSSKVQKEGTHPIVYPAAGSHATFYDDAVYIENGQNGSGLGCDNTSEPLRTVKPSPVLLPGRPEVGRPLEWLTYLGHWGQKEKGFNTGPQGPITKRQWLEPFSWMAGIRQDSPRLPGGATVGPAVTNAFCGAVATVSDLLNLEAKSRLQAILVVLGLLLLVLIPPLLTTWRPADLEPLRQRRAFGQLIRTARRFYGRHWKALVPIGLTAVPVIAAIDGLDLLLTGANGITTSIGGSDAHIQVAGSFRGAANPVGFAVVAGAVIALVRLVDEAKPAGFTLCYRAMLARAPRLIAGQLIFNVLVVLLLMTVIGIPYAIYKYVGWQFVQQQILFEDKSIREAFHASARLVRGNWWRTLRVAGFFWLLSIAAGPVLGFFLIFANFSPLAVNVIGALVFALLIPYVATGRTLLYLDLETRREEVPAAASPGG